MKRAILIKSCHRFYDRQAAIAHTWGMIFSPHLYCCVGKSVFPRSVFFFAAHLETATGDDYEDNSLKLREALRGLLESNNFDRLFICDDDTFVHPRRWLAHEPAGEFECRLFWPRTDAELARNGGLPWAWGGGGWWMSRRLCELYVATVTERCSWDDILATNVAREAGVAIIDRPDLYGGDSYGGIDDRVAADNQLITCHHVSPTEMRRLWKATREL
jgi:hypothetical protein